MLVFFHWKCAQCNHCQKVFNFRKHLVQHEKKESNKHICLECGKTLGSIAALRKHSKVQHEHVYRCPECTQGFINKSDLNVHMKTHRPEKPHECNHCSMKFSLKDNLDLHLTQHDNSENCCSLCSEKIILEITIEKFRSRLMEIKNHIC